jgi:PAS domain S-box-containing protein
MRAADWQGIVLWAKTWKDLKEQWEKQCAAGRRHSGRPRAGTGAHHNIEEGPPMQVHDNFENWDNYANKCSVCLHAVDDKGIILWANDTEFKTMGYKPKEYIGKFIGDFHVDEPVVNDILGRLLRDETVHAYPARLRARDGSTKYVMINSNVYHEKGGQFGHTRCFTTEIGEKAWKALKQTV